MATVFGKDAPMIALECQVGRIYQQPYDYIDAKTQQRRVGTSRALQCSFTDAANVPTLAVAQPETGWDIDLSLLQLKTCTLYITRFDVRGGNVQLRFAGYDLTSSQKPKA